MIARFSFPEGEPFPEDPLRMRQEIGKLLLAHQRDMVMVEPGTYDITPRLWTKHVYIHELTVLDTGDGMHRMHPRDKDVGYRMSNQEGGLTPFKPGGKVTPINDKMPFAFVAGGHPSKPTLQLFEVISFIPADIAPRF